MRGRTWTKDEEYELTLLWPREDWTVAQICRHFDRNEQSVRQRAQALRLHRPTRRMLDKYNRAIMQMYLRGDDVEDIAKHFDVTIEQMRNKIQRISDRSYYRQRLINRRIQPPQNQKLS